MRLCNPAGIQGKFRALRLFYECGQKENFGTHFLAGNFILRNMCQLLRFYLQVFLFFQRVRQKSPFGLSKKFSSPASEKCNPNQVSTPFTLILRLFCLVCGQQVTHIYNLQSFCIAVLQRSNFTSENILEMFTVLLVANKWLKHYCKFYL